MKTQTQKVARGSKSGWLFEWSGLEKRIYEEGNKIKNIQINLTQNYNMYTTNKGRNIKNQTNVRRK
jgi:hypothetical protein